MTDITPDINVCLKARGARPLLRKDFDIQNVDSFLQEAYSINARLTELINELRNIRPAYLSALPQPRRRQIRSGSSDRSRQLTDREKDEVDASSKQLLRQLNHSITQLRQAEEIRIQTQDSVTWQKRGRGGLSAISRWANGGAVTARSPEEEKQDAERKSLAAFREGVLWYLAHALEGAGRIQSEMMEIRLSREIEKSKSVLYKGSLGGGPVPYAQDEQDTNGWPGAEGRNKRKPARSANSAAPDDLDDGSNEAALTQEQQQLFAEENNALLQQYQQDLGQIRKAERSILEISEMHNTLHANLQQQSEHIDQLVQDSYLTGENVGKGNKELKKASERRSTAQALFYASCGLCLFLVSWDLIF